MTFLHFFDRATYLSFFLNLFLYERLSNDLWGLDVLLLLQIINIVSILFYNFIEFIILSYTFLPTSFALYKEYTICMISFSKFSDVLPACICASAIGNFWSICLGPNILRFEWSDTLSCLRPETLATRASSEKPVPPIFVGNILLSKAPRGLCFSCSLILFLYFFKAFPKGEYINLVCFIILLWSDGNISSTVTYSYLSILPNDKAYIFAASLLISYCSSSSPILSSIVMINFYIFPKRLFLKRIGLSDARVASATKEQYDFAVHFYKDS